MKKVAISFALLALFNVLLNPGWASAEDHEMTKSAKNSVGSEAADFELEAVNGELTGTVKLSDLTKESNVVVVVLRGYPGYQCGICSRQVGELVSNAKSFAAKDAKVLLIYPGPDDGLEMRSEEFLKGTDLPAPFTMLVDPGYKFTNLYGLRWKAPRETAYPSTFVVGQDGKISFSVVSHGHAGRAKTADIIKAL